LNITLKKIDKGKRAANIIENENIRITELNIRKKNKLLKEDKFLNRRVNRIRITFFIAHINRFPIFAYLKINIRSNTSI
jgi:hypothetical protein